MEKPKGPEEEVREAKDFNALYSILDNLKMVRGSQKEYTAERLKEKIDELRGFFKALPKNEDNSGYLDGPLLTGITSTHGLRKKVRELLGKEMSK
ncbi:MAG: hypothetical protein HZA36_00755 [Parcubacteria group bacterium]|nr:hypothetical protein [Parcubacteria group bacterium]